MNVLEAALRRVAADLAARRVPWAVIGGFAQVADTAELDLARDAVELIMERGFNRDRDLRAALAAMTAT